MAAEDEGEDDADAACSAPMDDDEFFGLNSFSIVAHTVVEEEIFDMRSTCMILLSYSKVNRRLTVYRQVLLICSTLFLYCSGPSIMPFWSMSAPRPSSRSCDTVWSALTRTTPQSARTTADPGSSSLLHLAYIPSLSATEEHSESRPKFGGEKRTVSLLQESLTPWWRAQSPRSGHSRIERRAFP